MAKPRTPRRTRAPRNWRDLFLEQLAQTSNIAAAARAARIDVSTVYKARRHEPAFAAAWRKALCEGYDNLEMALLYRLRTGETQSAKTQRKYDNGLGIRLLLVHREEVMRERARQEVEDEQTIFDAINAKLDLMRERMRAAREETPCAGGQPAITDQTK